MATPDTATQVPDNQEPAPEPMAPNELSDLLHTGLRAVAQAIHGDSEPAQQPIAPNEPLEVLRAGLQALERAIHHDRELTGDVEMILREHLGGTFTADTVTDLGAGLETCSGNENARFLIDVIKDNSPGDLEFMRNTLKPATWRWLRRLMGVHGPALRRAYALWNENPNGWSDASGRAFYDEVGFRWWISVQINKYDGTKLFLEDVPSSLLTLARGIISFACSIPPDKLKDLVPEELQTGLKSEVDKLLAACNPPPTEEQQDGANKSG
jgi:hypothetical protein